MSTGMANWEPARRHPPRTSSRWAAPGIFVNVEFGVSFTEEHRTHTASMKYTSRRMEERLHEERIRQQYEQGLHQQHPTILMPAHGIHQEHQARYLQQQAAHAQQQERQRRLGVRTREQHERGTSAPPTVTDRTQPISPISPISPIGSIRHTSSMPMDRTNQALPPTPSQFRLGEADLPWSMPPWYRSPEPELTSPTVPRVEVEPPARRLDDPQRVRDLETLHQAMMTVDSLNNDGWEPWTWDSVGDMPRGPRSIGWAVSSEDAPSREPISPDFDQPPAYVVSQWEQAFGRHRSRPRSSGT